MSEERDFFADEPSDAEIDAIFDGPAPNDVASPDEELPDDSETEEADSEESELEGEDPDDEGEDRGDEDEESEPDDEDYVSPVDDFEGWLNELDDDERGVVEDLVAQAEVSQNVQQNAVELINQAAREIRKRDLALRAMEQMVKISQLAQRDPERFRQFQNQLEWGQRQRQQQLNSPEAQRLRQLEQEARTFMARQIESDHMRENQRHFQATLDHVKAGKPLDMGNGETITLKNLNPLEERALAASQTPEQFDRTLYELRDLRRQRTEAARNASQVDRMVNGRDRGSVRSTGSGKRSANYNNYNLDQLDQYLDDIATGAR